MFLKTACAVGVHWNTLIEGVQMHKQHMFLDGKSE